MDLHQFESILYHWPLLGPALEVFVRGVLTLQIIGTARLAGWAWRLAEGCVGGRAAEGAARSADGGLAPAEAATAGPSGGGLLRGALGWAGRAAGAVWWREWFWRSWPGRLTVPYSMK